MTTTSALLRTYSVEHRALICSDAFDNVYKRLVAAVPELNPDTANILIHAEADNIAVARREWPRLWMFLARDHGQLTAADGGQLRAVQFEIGNPLTAERMTRYVLAAGLYAPLRIVLYEDSSRKAIFEYDLPSSLFSQFGDARVAAIGLELDMELETILTAVAYESTT